VTGAALATPAGPPYPEAAALWDRTLAQFPLPVAVYDREARLVAANETMTRVTGKTEEEMRGLPLREIESSRPFLSTPATRSTDPGQGRQQRVEEGT
jgi:PAS domain-containing protein